MQLRLAVIALTLMSAATAAELKQETVDAWDQYIQTVDQSMQNRLNPSRNFLWIDERPERASRVHAGEIVIEPVNPHNPKRVPSGLIHHWIGAEFIPNAHVKDMVVMLRDYASYKNYYKPAVVASALILRGDTSDQYSMVMLNNAFLKSAIAVDWESSFAQLEPTRWYSVSRSTRSQTIENYGRPNERKLPIGTGPGYLWSVHSVTRLMERDGGVYLEVEALALSRDIPVSLRWMIDPIVRRESKNSILTTLRETQSAVNDLYGAPAPAITTASKSEPALSKR